MSGPMMVGVGGVPAADVTVSSPHARRHRVAERDGWVCRYCDVLTACATCDPDVPYEVTATMDHVVPRSQGGPFSLSNLVIACQPCNQRKADKSEEYPHGRVKPVPPPWVSARNKHLTWFPFADPDAAARG